MTPGNPDGALVAAAAGGGWVRLLAMIPDAEKAESLFDRALGFVHPRRPIFLAREMDH